FRFQSHFPGDQDGVTRYSVRVAACVRVFFVDRAGQHLDGAQEQRAVFFRSFLQVIDELFQIVRHGVEGLRQFAELSAALKANTMGEIATGNGAAGFSQYMQRSGETPRGPDSNKDAEGNGDQSGANRVATHVSNVDIGFFLSLLRDNGPAQPGYREVGAEHGNAVLAFLDR